MEVLVAQLCLTICDPINCGPLGSSVCGILQAKNTGVGCYSLLQGILPTLGSNPGLLPCSRFFTIWVIRGYWCLLFIEHHPNIFGK